MRHRTSLFLPKHQHMPPTADNPAAKAPPAWYKVSATAAASEFFGSLLFAFFGGLATSQYAAFGNGLALAVCIYICVSVSGGHLNPAVTLATMISGHTPFLQGLLYVVMQAAGMIAGAAITLALKPAGLAHPGCFAPDGISRVQLWGWETMMTTLLVSCVFGVAVSQKVRFLFECLSVLLGYHNSSPEHIQKLVSCGRHGCSSPSPPQCSVLCSNSTKLGSRHPY